MQASNEWFVADAESEGKPLIVRGRLFLDALRQSGRYTTRIALVWPYGGDGKGLPTDKETRGLDLLNEQLRQKLEDEGTAILTAIFIGNRAARYEYYGTSAEEFGRIVEETFAQYPPLPIRIGAESDPEWKSYIETIQQFAIQP